MRPLSRRRYLEAVAVGTVGLAGCSGNAEESETDDSAADSSDAEPVDSSVLDCDPPEQPAPDTSAGVHEEYEQTVVTVQSADCETLGSVTAAIADTGDLRYTGLSDTESLPDDRGMLFVFDEEQDLAFVMREMDFPIDIVYADGDGVITSIHHAEAPGSDEDGENLRYPGRGQYVLEVNRDWTTERGVEAGDRLFFGLP
jgi:uncharacterized membrane protein (UPF0127 family)